VEVVFGGWVYGGCGDCFGLVVARPGIGRASGGMRGGGLARFRIGDWMGWSWGSSW